ncbi:MAG: hypothetical protein ACRD47_07150 [Nitrososphaeraceae archaeon]
MITIVMFKRAQTKFLLPSTSQENQVLIVEEFSQLNEKEDPEITEIDNEMNIHDATFTCKSSTQNNEILIRYYSHRTIQNISNN